MESHQGGEEFFTLLDSFIKQDKDLFEQMITYVNQTIKYDYIIVSGEFGRLFRSYVDTHPHLLSPNRLIVVNGSLRKNAPIDCFWEFYDIKNKDIVFIDDSFYSGKTRNIIASAIQSNDGRLLKTFCYYDGSKIPDKNVVGFYRWHDERCK